MNCVCVFFPFNSVLLSGIKQLLVEKTQQEQSLKTCHGSALKSKVLSFTVTRSLGSKYAERSSQPCASSIAKATPATGAQGADPHVCGSARLGIAEVFPRCFHENQYFQVSRLAHDAKLNLDIKLGSLSSDTP